MIGSIVGAGLSAVGSIFGGIQASKAMKKAKKNIEARRAENEAWYNRRYDEDATQRADAQRILNLTQENIRNRNQAAAGAQAVVGGTEESLAATKAANNEAMADAASRIAAAGERRKEQVEQAYRQRQEQLNNELNNLEYNRAGNIAAATKGVLQAGGSLMDAFDGTGDSKKK